MFTALVRQKLQLHLPTLAGREAALAAVFFVRFFVLNFVLNSFPICLCSLMSTSKVSSSTFTQHIIFILHEISVLHT